MEHFDVIVMGLGAMGSAACCALSRRGLSTLGIEQFAIGHDRGSSHGDTRVIRKAYFEDPRYVPMAQRAFTLWHELENATGEKLVHLTGCLNLGPAEHECVRGARQSAEQHGLPFEMLDAAEVCRRWPGFVPNEHDVGVFEADAGYLRPELCIDAMIRLAKSHGCCVETERRVIGWRRDGEHLLVETDADTWQCHHLVICAGPWLPVVARELNLPLRVERQVQTWFAPARPELFSVGRFPVFIHFLADRAYYGIPASHRPWVKIARHHGGIITTADEVDRSISAADEADIRSYIQRHLPEASGPLMEGKVCLYTNTPDDHFIVDRHPDHANVLIAGGFSGHGFKFAPVIGQMLAEMVTDGRSSLPIEMFSLKRLR